MRSFFNCTGNCFARPDHVPPQAMMAQAPTCASRGIFGCGEQSAQPHISIIFLCRARFMHISKRDRAIHSYSTNVVSYVNSGQCHQSVEMVFLTNFIRWNGFILQNFIRWSRFLQLLQGHPRGQPRGFHVNALQSRIRGIRFSCR